MSRKGWLQFITLCVIWGIPYLFIRIAMRELSPPSLILLRCAPAALLLLPFALRRDTVRRVLAAWPWVLTYTATEICVPWLLLNHAETRISSSLAGLLVAMVPLIGIVLYRLAGEESHFDIRRLSGLFVGFAGVAALVGLDIGRTDALGIFEVTIVALGYAIGPLLISRRLHDVPPLGVVTASLAITAAVYAPWGIAVLPSSLSAQTIAAAAVLAVACTAVAFLVFFALIREVGPARSTLVTYVNPLVAVLLGAAVLNESLTPGILIGTPLILLGSLLGTAPSLHDKSSDGGKPPHDTGEKSQHDNRPQRDRPQRGQPSAEGSP